MRARDLSDWEASGELMGGAGADRRHSRSRAAPDLSSVPNRSARPRVCPRARGRRGRVVATLLLAVTALAGSRVCAAGDDVLLGSGSDALLPKSGAEQPASGAKTEDELLGSGAGQGSDALLPPAGAPASGTGADDALLGSGAGQGSDALLPGSGGLLGGAPEDVSLSPGTQATSESAEPPTPEQADQAHAALFLESRYPSAHTCATCHPKQYKEWSVSQHAYTQLSPVYMAMQITINAKTSGTLGDFCIRCHNQVGMNLGESIYISNLDRHATSREGITCVVCHRVNKNYGKVSGRLAIQEGDIYEPVYGPRGGAELQRVINSPEYRVVPERGQPGRAIHAKAERFFELTKPGFCGTCHDVTLLDGFRLEQAYGEYKSSPAAAKGITCQDCHMGKVQGVASGYEEGPAALVGGVPTRPRKLANHYFAGPDYPVVHPGIFPHNTEAADFKTMREWLQFDYAAGWGTDAFESHLPASYEFPEAWRSIDDRYDGRKIVDQQLKRLAWARERRLEVLRNGFALGDIRVRQADGGGITFSVDVRSKTDGHGVPTGFDAERLCFLEVTVTDAAGKVVYVSGDRDPNGDLRDDHSEYVHDGELPLDPDLFNLQSKFAVRLLRGGERDQVLTVNTSLGALPFVRPETRATTLYGRPRGARKHRKTIEPLGSRTAAYSVPADSLMGRGPYRIQVRLIAQMVPVNLIAAIQGVGLDYGMSPKGLAEAVVRGAEVLWEREAVIDPSAGKTAQDDERPGRDAAS